MQCTLCLDIGHLGSGDTPLRPRGSHCDMYYSIYTHTRLIE